MVATFEKSSVRNARTSFRPPIVTYAKVPLSVVREVDVVRDGSSVDRLQNRKRRARIEDHHFAHVLQREPHLGAIGRGSDVRAEGARLCNPADYLMVSNRNHHRLRTEG